MEAKLKEKYLSNTFNIGYYLFAKIVNANLFQVQVHEIN